MNKKIVVTGGTRGIGRAIVERFAAGGFDIAVCARSADDLALLNSKLKTQNSKLITQACDVTKKEELQRFTDKVLKEFGSVDILVNNAGTFLPGQVYNEKEGTLETMIETNLYSAYHISRMLIPPMIKAKRGHIFNMCSVASIGAYPNGGSYSISKFALLGLSKALREELKEFHIKVTALIAGAAYTDSWASSGLPEGRFMKVEDIANLVWDLYHLSENSVVEEVLLRPMAGDIR
jgi:short-subunit dehydrogenase